MNELDVDKELLHKELRKIGVKDFLKSNTLKEVYFMLSLRCNLRCRICAWWGLQGPCRNKEFFKKYEPVIKLSELMAFAKEILDFNPRQITFSGGEPLLDDKWYYLAKFFAKKQVKVSLTTNGVLLLNKFEWITEVVDEINLSLGGPPSILPIIRENKPEHFDFIMKGLKKLTDFKSRNNGLPKIRILYTISDLSYKHMGEIIKFMEKNKIAIDHYHFQHLMFINNPTFKQQKKEFYKKFGIKKLDLWKGYVFSSFKLDFLYFSKEVEKLRRLNNVSFSPDLHPDELEFYYLFNRGALNYNKYCTAPWHQIDIMPNGNIYTCHDLFIGNLREKRFNDIWNGEVSKKLRKHVSQKLFPACKGCFYLYCDRKR